MASIRGLEMIRERMNYVKKNENNGPSLNDMPKSSLATYKKVRDDLRTIYLAKCMDEYYIHYEECEEVRRLLFEKPFD